MEKWEINDKYENYVTATTRVYLPNGTARFSFAHLSTVNNRVRTSRSFQQLSLAPPTRARTRTRAIFDFRDSHGITPRPISPHLISLPPADMSPARVAPFWGFLDGASRRYRTEDEPSS